VAPSIQSTSRADRNPTPVVIGLGRTGLRIATELASIAGPGLRLMVLFPDKAPRGASDVPVLAWPVDGKRAVKAANELRARTGDAPAAVIVVALAASASASIAKSVAEALRQDVRNLAAVGVAPFTFEGPEKTEFANSIARSVGNVVDLFAVASRNDVRSIIRDDVPLEQACQKVDHIAASAAEALARSLARRQKQLIMPGACAVGAAAADGIGCVSQAVRDALFRSLIGRKRLAASRDCLLALALGRTPTIGEVCASEDMLRSILAPDARITFEMATDPTLGDRALAAVCVAASNENSRDEIFPSEDAGVLEVPAFLRRRSSMYGGDARWPKTA
jgi:cell division protein FtsZ